MVERAQGLKVAHPLDPLSKSELEFFVASLRSSGHLDHRHLIAMAQLEEPSKSALFDFESGKAIDRAARVTLLDRSTGKVSESVITTLGELRSHKIIEGAKAPILSVESHAAIAAAKADPRVIEALRQRGITDLETVRMETWPIGAQIPKYLDDGRRIIWTPMWHCPTPNANFYAHPISGLNASRY